MNHNQRLLTFIAFCVTILFSACGGGGNKEAAQESAAVVPVLEQIWSTDSVFKMPESALYDADREVIYVSNINQEPRMKDGNGFISRMKKDGSDVEVEWVTGLSGPKGLALKGNLLYVADIDEVVEIDVTTGTITRKISFPEAGMLNDMFTDAKGTVYMTDMDSGRVCYLEGDKIQIWLTGLNKPNGILVEDDAILVGAFDGTLNAYDLSTKEPKTLGNNMNKCDGIVKTGAGKYLVSNWDGEIFSVDEQGPVSIFSSKEQNIQSADIGIIKGENIILVPTFNDNRIVAYQLK